MLTEEGKMIARLRRNKEIKEMGLTLKRVGNCQIGDCIQITKDDRIELFRFREDYDELLKVVLDVFKS